MGASNMTTYERYCKIRDSKGLKDSHVAAGTGIGKSTFSDWKNGRSNPKNDKLQKIADFFGITVNYFFTDEESTKNSTPILTKRDHRDIKKSVDEIMTSLDENSGETLYYDGVEVHLSDETKALLRNALTLTMQAVKLENKEKYNPHKNGK